MSSTHGLPGRLGEPSPGEMGDYQAISALAVASLLVGAASATAIIGAPLWIVPLVGILLSWLALFRIDRSAGTLSGRPLALAGLGLAVCFGAAGIADYFYSQRLVARDAQQVANRWFLALAQGEPELAHQWTRPIGGRAGLVDPQLLKNYYEEDKERRDALAAFVGQKPIATLLRLGARAHVELDSTTGIDVPMAGFVTQVYRVTSDEAGGPAPFLDRTAARTGNDSRPEAAPMESAKLAVRRPRAAGFGRLTPNEWPRRAISPASRRQTRSLPLQFVRAGDDLFPSIPLERDEQACQARHENQNR